MATQVATADPSSVFKNEEQLKMALTEMKSLSNPPQGVKDTMAAVTVLLGYDTSWQTAKKLMSDVKQFIEKLKNCDKDNINPTAMATVRNYTSKSDFTPESMAKKSKASELLCKWVLALEKYYTDKEGQTEKTE